MSQKKRSHKQRAAPRTRATYKTRGGRKDAADKTTFNPPHATEGAHPTDQPGVLTDEDRTGKFIGRFGGAGQPPLSKH